MCFDEDLTRPLSSYSESTKAQCEQKARDARNRKSLVLDSSQIFAYDGKAAEPLQSWMREHLASQLSRCDICVREFHRGRRELRQKLEEYVIIAKNSRHILI